jgi:hypothetical protein
MEAAKSCTHAGPQSLTPGGINNDLFLAGHDLKPFDGRKCGRVELPQLMHDIVDRLVSDLVSGRILTMALFQAIFLL